MSQLRSVTCHMGSHSVTCYPTQVYTPRLNPSHTGLYSIYLPRMDGKAELWAADDEIEKMNSSITVRTRSLYNLSERDLQTCSE